MAQINDLMYKYFRAAVGQTVKLVTDGVIVANSPIDVRGSSLFTVSVQEISGSDVYRIEGRLDGLPFYIVQNTINANQHYTFTGAYDELRVVKASGSGTAAEVSLRYGR